MVNYFHFFSYKMAIRFHISKRLESLGWKKTNQKTLACFSDRNLSLDDQISLNLEYKHLLSQLLKSESDIMPLTYEINDDNYSNVLAQIYYENVLQGNGQNPEKWILKPSMLNNGDNIKLFDSVEDLQKYYQSKDRLGGWHVVQKYISPPDLMDNRKYTYRMLVVMTNYAGVYLFKNGYVNLCSQVYNKENLSIKKAHVTNYVIDGEFANIEQKLTCDLPEFSQDYRQIGTIIKKVMRVLLKRYPNYLKRDKIPKFEIFGFDFIKDNNKKLWLLEINQGPDAPTFEENKLNEPLWNVFWQSIVNDFVIPCATDQSPLKDYQGFEQLFTKRQCTPWWRRWGG